jgi:hypothetical protein
MYITVPIVINRANGIFLTIVIWLLPIFEFFHRWMLAASSLVILDFNVSSDIPGRPFTLDC